MKILQDNEPRVHFSTMDSSLRQSAWKLLSTQQGFSPVFDVVMHGIRRESVANEVHWTQHTTQANALLWFFLTPPQNTTQYVLLSENILYVGNGIFLRRLLFDVRFMSLLFSLCLTGLTKTAWSAEIVRDSWLPDALADFQGIRQSHSGFAQEFRQAKYFWDR